MNRGGDRSGGLGGPGGPRRERRWQTSQERARVAAELIEEAESLTKTGAIASPDDVARDQQPPPIRVQPLATPAPHAPQAPQAKLDSTESPESPESPEFRESPESPKAPEEVASRPETAGPVSDDPLYVA